MIMRVEQTDILNNTFFAVEKKCLKKYMYALYYISARELWTHNHDRSQRVCLVDGLVGWGVLEGGRGGRVR